MRNANCQFIGLFQLNTSLKPLALAIGLLSCAGQVTAQSNTLESILVTADRQQSQLGDIPSSIYSVDEEFLELISATHINEALARVPGTWISRGNGQEHLTAIRSPVLTGAGSCGAFQMSQDGIPLRAAGFCNVNQLFESNYEQAGSIEVIRGPGSVLYGANALHGTINVISRGVTEELSGDVSLEFGKHSYKRLNASVSNSFGKQGIRLSMNGMTDDGYIDDSGFDQQKLSFLHEYNGDSLSISTGFSTTNLNQETAGFLQGDKAYKDDDLKTINNNPEAFRDASSYRLHSKIEWETDLGTWMLTPFYRNTEMDFLMHFLPGAPLEENGQESFGFQGMLRGGNETLNWLVGIDGEFTEGFLRQTQAGIPDTQSAFLRGTLPVGKQYDFAVDAEMFSVYGQIQYQLSQKNQLTLGLRSEHLEYDYDNKMIDGRTRDDGTSCGFGGCRYSRPADRDDSFSNVSAQIGWIHDFNEEQQVFINLSHAFRAPQATEMYRLQNSQVVADLDSEEVESFELGYRASFEEVNFGVSLYYMRKDNVIFQDSSRNNVSGGETEHKGVELNAAFTLTENLTFTVAGSFAHHTYQSNIAPRGVTVVIDGNDIDTAPRETGSAQLNWKISERQTAELEFIHLGAYFTDEANQHEYRGHALVNLRYQAELESGWFLGLRITNLMDEEYAERADFGFGNERYFVGEARGLYMSIGSRF